MEDLVGSASLPRLILIGDGFTDRAMWDRILDVAEDVPWIHLRDHEAHEATFHRQATELVEHIWMVSPSTMISINGHLKTADELGTGYHAGTRGATVAQARKQLGPEALVGFSAHYVTEAQQAVKDGADYVFFSPIFASPSKPGHLGLGLEELRTFCDRMRDTAPVFALGGITPERVTGCLEAGAYGVGVLSGILGKDDSRKAALEFLDALVV